MDQESQPVIPDQLKEQAGTVDQLEVAADWDTMSQIVLVNVTPYRWKLIDSDYSSIYSYWGFKSSASTIDPFTTCAVWVGLKNTWSGSAHATYQLDGTSYKFKIRANSAEIWADFTDIFTHNASRGQSYQMGRIEYFPTYFVLSGVPGDFNSIGDVSNWMQTKLSLLGQRNLSQICVAASHDTGMNKVTWKTTLAPDGSILTQIGSIEEQLKLGVRIFDIRPYVFNSSNDWACGHYSYADALSSWQGGNGVSIQSIVDGINRFTKESKELIVLRLDEVRHVTNRPGEMLKWEDVRGANSDEWRRLLTILSTIDSLWTPPSSLGPLENIELTKVPLKDFIGQYKAAVVIVADHPFGASEYKGVFPSSSWHWNSSPWPPAEESKRLQKFRDDKAASPLVPYSYSGCHTQTNAEAVKNRLGDDKCSVFSLSKPPKFNLFKDLLPACTKDRIPNALSFDRITHSDMAAMAMAFTDIALPRT